MRPTRGKGQALPPLGLSIMQGWAAGVLIAWLAGAPGALAAEVSFCPASGLGRLRASVESLQERRWKHVVRQSLDISCGSGALATLLNYQFGDHVSESVLIQAILKNVKQETVRRRGGFTLLDLKKVATEFGYRVHGYKLTMNQLRTLGSPALVGVTLRTSKHFIVCRGMVGDRVVLADPAFGNTLVKDDEFQRMWGGVALVLEKDGEHHFPSQLDITEDDLPIAETDGSLRALNRATIPPVIEPDAF